MFVPSKYHHCAHSEGVQQWQNRCTVVVEVAVVSVIYGGISHISRIVVVVAALVKVVVVVLVLIQPHTWDCRHCPSALHWETDGQRERLRMTQTYYTTQKDSQVVYTEGSEQMFLTNLFSQIFCMGSKRSEIQLEVSDTHIQLQLWTHQYLTFQAIQNSL